jgi:serine phosphatase RsbU (regulator of sigma subunit)
MDKLKPLLPFLVLFFLSLAAVAWLFPSAHWLGAIRTPLSPEQVIERSRSLMDSLGIDPSKLSPNAQLHTNRGLVRQTQALFGIERSNRLLRDSLPGFYWEISWRLPKNLFSLSSATGSGNEMETKEIVEQLIGDVSVGFDVHGQLRSFRRSISDTLPLLFISREEARGRAEDFLRHFAPNFVGTEDTAASILPPAPESKPSTGGVRVQNDKEVQHKQRVDYEFRWTTQSSLLNEKILVSVGTAGNLIALFKAEYDVPAKFNEDQTAIAYTVAVALLYAGMIILMVVMAFRRIRSYEIGFRGAVIVGVVSGLIMGVELYFTISEQLGWAILLPLVLGPLFMGGALILLWAVTESVVRETWKEKYVTMDLLLNGHIFHSRVGASFVKGISFAAAALAVFLIGSSIASRRAHLWVGINDDSAVRLYDVFSQTLHILSYGVFAVVFVYAFFVLFSVSSLRRFLRSPLLVLITGAMIFGTLNAEHLRPLWAGIPIQFFVGLVFVAALLYGDALAAFFAMYGYGVIKETLALVVAAHPEYIQSAIFVCAWGAAGLGLAVIAQFRTKEIADFDAITPAFAKLISERERLQQELSIAREVQMSFLPKANPTFASLDIASRCAPAMEVGGDYFDFIEISKSKLGIAVGDVSGKGTQAAFYMTLTKGFLRALATSTESPASILQSVNKLFYENVERGVFISMVYGLFDARKKILTVARAGHNPVIMCKSAASTVQTLNPKGLALGLDKGATFEKSMQEIAIPFQSGDLFVFYTDGFPEAMNTAAEEFGQARLCATVERYAKQSAAEILDGIFAEMKLFVGKAKQHDDMTIVVVKVL